MALPPPRDWTPILWSLTFLAVNGQKIYQILVERRGSAVLTANEQGMYSSYFQPHGITMKQFQYIMEKARTIRLQKGDILIREGAVMRDVFLVTAGQTRAHFLGRRLTAVSYEPQQQQQQQRGGGGEDRRASGAAWVGEMAFIERNWNKEENINSKTNNQHADGPSNGDGETSLVLPRKSVATERAMYTIVALEDDTTVLAWSHADMEALLERSSDMRAGLTRAMTASIVGKVVGFAKSKKAAASRTMASWLGSLSWFWGNNNHDDATRIVETSEPPKVAVGDKSVYTLSDGKDCSTT